jgi:hypothetical protein
MTLPTSGALSLQDIANEFGGGHPIALSNYYAGGPHVPSGTSGTYGPVPSSGAISIQNFYGTRALGPFVAGSSGGSSSGASGGGAGHTINDIADVTATASVVSGGPTSGSFSYLWAITSGPSSGSATLSNSTLATCNIHFNWYIAAASSDSNTVIASCTITDTVSGYSSTVTGVNISRGYTNNTG